MRDRASPHLLGKLGKETGKKNKAGDQNKETACDHFSQNEWSRHIQSILDSYRLSF